MTAAVPKTYTKLNHRDFWPDVFRLLPDSKVGIGLVLWGFRMAGEETGWTPWVTWVELAGLFCCSVKAVQNAVAELDGLGRGVIEAEVRRGEVRFKLLTEMWESLPDYQPGRKKGVL
jgi:hypothetical protein